MTKIYFISATLNRHYGFLTHPAIHFDVADGRGFDRRSDELGVLTRYASNANFAV
jgi:hypothetical protein